MCEAFLLHPRGHLLVHKFSPIVRADEPGSEILSLYPCHKILDTLYGLGFEVERDGSEIFAALVGDDEEHCLTGQGFCADVADVDRNSFTRVFCSMLLGRRRKTPS